MFELSVACKYLRPRWRQLSVSIISLISILVIALVVWLIVVFFSVTQGLEKRWFEKLIALTAPVRIMPTETYYDSYYYQIDSISEKSDYNLKNISEKLASVESNPYNPEIDEEIPAQFAAPDLDNEGLLKDPVKLAFEKVANLKKYDQLRVAPFEVTASQMRLKLLRYSKDESPLLTQAFLSQSIFLASLDNSNSSLIKASIPFSDADANNLLLALSSKNDDDFLSKKSVFKDRTEHFSTFFQLVQIPFLKTPTQGWTAPGKAGAHITKDVLLKAALIADSLKKAANLHQIQFDVKLDDYKIEAKVPLHHLIATNTQIQKDFKTKPEKAPFWFYHVGDTSLDKKVFLPTDPLLGEGVLLPKSFKDAGVLLGDSGYLSYQIPTASAMQEQRIKIFVAGFYDQGLISIGGKFVIVNDTVTHQIGSTAHDGKTQSNGINVRFANLDDADMIKAELQKSFNDAGIASYWKIETFKEFEFAKDLILQLSSDKHLFSLIAAVIIIVACSNIISMLIILVNDKKVEIGILRSMGASSFSIAFIFGFCGMVMGVTGSIIGIVAAILTLKNLDAIVHFMSVLQGHQAFNPLFYGDSLPNEISGQVMLYVICATALISLLSGLVPALKASLLRPSTILRSE